MKSCIWTIVLACCAPVFIIIPMAFNFHWFAVALVIIIVSSLSIYIAEYVDDEDNTTSTPTIKVTPKETTITDKDKRIFKECWLYTDFVKNFGKIKEIKTFTNSHSGKEFKSCIIKNKQRNLFIRFSSSLGELSFSEINKKQKELKVGLSKDDNYVLFDDKISEYEIVDLGDIELDFSETKNLKDDKYNTITHIKLFNNNNNSNEKELIKTSKKESQKENTKQQTQFIQQEKNPTTKTTQSQVGYKVEEIDSFPKELSNDQKVLLAIYADRYTGSIPQKALKHKRLFGIIEGSSSYELWKYYELRSTLICSDLQDEYNQVMLNILISVRDKEAQDKFIRSCCISSYFYKNPRYVNEFIYILINWGYTKEKVQKLISMYKESIKDSDILVPLVIFENNHGTLEVGCVVNNNTGDYFHICKYANYKGVTLYIGFSPYLGKLNHDTVKRIKDKLYIRYDGNGCYFLCTKESEERCRTDTDKESQMCHYIEYDAILSVLKELNVEGKVNNYTFTSEKDF